MAAGLLPLLLAGGFRWQVAEGCPSETAVREQAEAVIGEPVAWSRLDIEGVIETDDDAFELTLEIRTGERDVTRKVIRDADCEVLTATAAVVVAVAAEPVTVARRIEPDLAERQREALDEPDPPAAKAEVEPTREAPAPAAPAEPVDPGRARAPLRGAVGAHSLVGAGLLPTVDLGLGASGALVGPRWQVELRAGGLLPRRIRYRGTDAGATMNAGIARLVAGPRWVVDRVELALLAGGAAALIVSRGFGLPRTEQPIDAWLGLGASPVVGLRLGPAWIVRLGIDVDIALRRPAIRADGAQSLYRAPPVAAHLTLGLQWRFPRMAPGEIDDDG